MQAAFGLNQIKRLDESIKRRHEISKYYDIELKNLPLVTPWQSPGTYSSYHLYPILIEEELTKITQKQVYNYLIANGIAVNLHYIPVHRHPYYENLGFKKNDFPQAENFHRKVLSIPMHAALKNEQQKYVVEILTKAMNS